MNNEYVITYHNVHSKYVIIFFFINCLVTAISESNKIFKKTRMNTASDVTLSNDINHATLDHSDNLTSATDREKIKDEIISNNNVTLPEKIHKLIFNLYIKQNQYSG